MFVRKEPLPLLTVSRRHYPIEKSLLGLRVTDTKRRKKTPGTEGWTEVHLFWKVLDRHKVLDLPYTLLESGF